MSVSVYKNRTSCLGNIANQLSDRYIDVPNLKGLLYSDTKPVKALSHFAIPEGEGEWKNWPFDKVVQQKFNPVDIGTSYGPTWATHWFKVEIDIPSTWVGKEVRLRWKSNSEAMVYSSTGVPLQGLSTGKEHQYRGDYVISGSHSGVGSVVYYVEMACNNLFGAGSGPWGDIQPPAVDCKFQLSRCEIAVFENSIYKLIMDLEMLSGIADEVDETRGYEAMYTANYMVTLVLQGNYTEASKQADKFWSSKAGDNTHVLSCIGNCHIDSAWLWPYSETIRKAARSFSAQIRLMEKYPDYKFVASQAQQYEWVRDYFPALFNEIKQYVADGKFIIVGGTWIEMDGNIPTGESFVRQFLYGQRFYQQEFGRTCPEFWLPDTFGYSPNIPQIIKHFGISRFLTQKMSWNSVNKFPHNTFNWEGLDGSTVLAHFPPTDTYTSDASAKELLYTVSNMRDKGRTTTSALLYGYGDGGGGPHQDMLERLNRCTNVNGMPKCNKTSSEGLFTALEANKDKYMKWTGELYLELHNGTYTSHAELKRLNRRCEERLHDAELLLSMANAIQSNDTFYTKANSLLHSTWKNVLLGQFHDVIPGTSIQIAMDEARLMATEALSTADQVYHDAYKQLFGSPSHAVGQTLQLVNTLPWPRLETVTVSSSLTKLIGIEGKSGVNLQPTAGGSYVIAEVGSMGYNTQSTHPTPTHPVTVADHHGVYTLGNGYIHATVDGYGRVAELGVAGFPMNAVKKGEFHNQIVMFNNMPLYWDAWDVFDYHLESRTPLNNEKAEQLVPVKIVESGPLVVKLEWSMHIGASSHFSQQIILRAEARNLEFHNTVDWKENRKMLKVEFPMSVLTRSATYECQFGHLKRPTHTNTSWEWAKYEVCGHKWADMSQNGFGVSVMNDSKYGWSGIGHMMRLSLLKAPKCPDPTTDMRVHQFKYAVMPHKGTFEESNVIQRAYDFNVPINLHSVADISAAAKVPTSWFTCSNPAVILETVKPAEDDGQSKVIVRMFEDHGSTTTATISTSLPVNSASNCNGMEQPGDPLEVKQDGGQSSITLSFTPFQLRAVLLVVSHLEDTQGYCTSS